MKLLIFLKIVLGFERVKKQNSVFWRWEFRTEQHDIQFAVYRSDASGARQTVVEPRRISCQGKGLPEVGIITCSDAPAKCKQTLYLKKNQFQLGIKNLHLLVLNLLLSDCIINV